MRRPASTWRILIVSALIAATGCSPTQPFYLHEDGDLSHYIDKATQAELPDTHAVPLADVEHSAKPLTLSSPDFKEFWELSLEECVAISLCNTKIIRGGTAARLQNGQIFAGTSEGSLLLNSVGRAFASTYDPAIVESNPGFSQFNLFGAPTAEGASVDGGVANIRQGVEAALSEFDAQVSFAGNPGSVIASSTDRPQNVNTLFSGFPQTIDTRDGAATYQVSKRSAAGTQFFFRGSTDYGRGNTRGQFQALNSTWTQTLEVEARHPLLRGAGTQINRMPVIIARIGTDIELMSVQAQLQDMLNNVEVRYWDLYLAYRNLETAKVGRDSALVTWRIVYDKWAAEVEPIQAEAQAREQYFSFRAQVENALRTLYDSENELRLLMGLTATDGRLIRPKDDPTLARVNFEWCDILAESVARRPELIAKRWEIKTREMELILARNRLLPQLDVGAFYRWLGVGDDLIEADRNGIPFPDEGSTAWEELTDGKYQEWGLLLSYQMPVGFRRELAGVRHAQLRLVREKALLEDMELDVSHGLTRAVRNLDANFQLSQTNANRWAASQKEVEAMEALYRGGKVALNDVLEAQRRRAVAQSSFWTSVTEYNKAIADLHTRKGSIMEYDGIGFEEGPWPQKAYWDALAQARKRDAGTYIDYGWTRPKVISRGEMPQHGDGIPLESIPEGATIQEAPAGEPTPAAPKPRAAGEGDTLPAPEAVPLETRRVRPLSPAQPRISSAGLPSSMTKVARAEAAESEAGTEAAPEAAGVQVVAAADMPAAEYAPRIRQAAATHGDSGIVNPLRSN